jgi:Winged helix DNA-binding domain
MTNRTTEVPRLSWTQVCARRLDRHALSAPSQDARPADIVGTMCGAHAQVLSAAELSIGLRLVGVTRADVREALWTERSLVKTFGPRGTVHLLSAQDLPWWIGALSAIPVLATWVICSQNRRFQHELTSGKHPASRHTKCASTERTPRNSEVDTNIPWRRDEPLTHITALE